MRKIADMVLIFILCCSFCACSTGTNYNSATEKDNVLHKVKNEEPDNSGKSVNQQMAGLKILNDTETLASCYTDAGYYYLTEDVAELENGEYGAHLMCMDFATKQEIYLCSNTGCKHNTPDCPAVFVMDEFPICTSGIFAYGDKLYVLSKEMDNEGAVTQDFYDPDGQLAEAEASQAVLYEMDTDGTNRHKVYSFDAGLTVEDTVLGNSEGLYFVTKKLSESTAEDSKSVTTSSGKTLLFWDADTKSAKEICKLDFDDGITRKIIGCLDNALVLSGVDYGKELTTDDYTMSDDDWNDMYKNSTEVISTLDLNTQKLSEKYCIDNQTLHSMAVVDNTLYVSYKDTGEIKAVNLENGEEKLLCSFTQNYIMNKLDDILCCQTWDASDDHTFYFVNTKTGEIQNSPLVNKALGWNLDFKAETGSKILVIYDYEYTPLGDDSYDITKYKYALIEKSDLYAGNGNYEPVKMIGKGC